MQLENNILNEEEILDLFNQYNKGNINAMKKLVLHNLKLIIFIIKQLELTNTDYDELINIGTLGLMKAINTFDINKKIKLTTYASRCIKNELLMYIRKREKVGREISIQTVININENGEEFSIEGLLIDNTKNVEQEVIKNIENNIIDNIVEELPKRDKEIIKLYFGFYDDICYTQEDISRIYNISQSRISRIINRNLPKIKQKYLERV